MNCVGWAPRSEQLEARAYPQMLRASTSLIARHPGSFLSSAAAQHLASGARALRGVQQEQQQQPHSLLYGACRRLACSAAVLGTRQAAAAAGAAGSVQQGSSITQHMATASTWAGRCMHGMRAGRGNAVSIACMRAWPSASPSAGHLGHSQHLLSTFQRFPCSPA